MRVSRRLLGGAVLAGSLAGAVGAQTPGQILARDWRPGDTVWIVPSTQYGEWPPLLPITGKGHRDFWRTPIRVPVADLSTLGGGGVTPERLGGGFMSRTLHSSGADGRDYVFRTVDKFPAQGLPEDLQETVVADFIQGQVAALNPVGALVAAPLMEAVGVLHVTPTYYAMPDDPRLGEWRETFAGRLVLFEERPDDGPDGTAGFAGSRRIRNTDNLREELEEDPAHRLAVEELLRARLVDLLLGDRDRSVNNWLWARFDDGDRRLWRPIPRDRDQVFVNFDGFGRGVARLFDPRLVRWGAEIPSVVGLSRNAWDIDRNLLTGLDRDDWERITREVQGRLTDAVLDDAVRRMPAAHHELAGARILGDLRARRDDLMEASLDLYDIVNRFADVVRTDADEWVRIRRLADGDLRIEVHPRPVDGLDPVGDPWFARHFRRGDTEEVRLYLHGGDDVTIVEGDGPGDILVRVIAGGGTDDLVVDPGSGGRGLIFYDDDGDGRRAEEGNEGVRVERRRPDQPELWPSDGSGPGTPDFGGAWIPTGAFGYAASNGLVLGLGGRRTGYGFEQDEYRYRFTGLAGYATGPGKPIVEVDYEVRNVLHGVHFFADGRFTPVEVLRYGGFGNETPDAEDPAFFDPAHTLAELRAGVRLGTPRIGLELGAGLRRLDSDTTGTTLLAVDRPYGSGRLTFATVFADAHFDGRARPGRPSRGVQALTGISLTPGGGDVSEGRFGHLRGELRATIARRDELFPHLAVRVGGIKTFGTVPFSEGAFVGGPNSIRGLDVDRYLGDASAFAAVEGRVRLFSGGVLVPADYGVLGFVDTGRVYLDGESSDRWHTGYGGGIWASPAISEYAQLRDVAAVFSVGFGDDDKKFYFGLGYRF